MINCSQYGTGRIGLLREESERVVERGEGREVHKKSPFPSDLVLYSLSLVKESRRLRN